VCFDFLYNFVEILLILRRTQRDVMIKLCSRFARKVPVILVTFRSNWNPLDRLSKNPLLLNFMNIRSVGAQLFHTTHIVPCHNLAHALWRLKISPISHRFLWLNEGGSWQNVTVSLQLQRLFARGLRPWSLVLVSHCHSHLRRPVMCLEEVSKIE
jgi:hypothetical protein